MKSSELGLVSVSMWLKMVPSAKMPLFLNPIMAMKKPMPAAIACFKEGGIMSKIIWRMLLRQSRTKRMPSSRTAVRAKRQE